MTRAILLAFLLPLAARAQVSLLLMNGSAEVPIGNVLNLGKVASGDILSARLRVRNIGTSAATVSDFNFNPANPGFTIDRPSMPFKVAAGSVQDVLVSFSSAALGLYSANLQLKTDANNITVPLTVTVVVGPLLTVFPVCTGSNGPPPSIDFGHVLAGQLRLCNFSLQNPGAQAMTIATFQLTGSGFQISSGPKAPFTIAAGDAVTFVINFTPAAAGSYTGALAIETRTYALTGSAFDTPTTTPLSTPLLQFDSGPFQSSQTRQLSMALPAAAPVAASGFVNLAFVPDSSLVAGDPSIVFLATGTRTLPFAIHQGSTLISINGQASVTFKTGTSSGQLRFTLSGISTDSDPTKVITIPPVPITIDPAIATKRTGNLDIQLTGFDNTYSAGSMAFTFFDTSGHALSPGAIPADFTKDFRTFFTNTQTGSAFQVRVSFPVTGDASGIGSVDVRLSNSFGITSQHLVFQ